MITCDNSTTYYLEVAPANMIELHRWSTILNNILSNEFDLVDFDENIDLFNLLHSIGQIVEIGR